MKQSRKFFKIALLALPIFFLSGCAPSSPSPYDVNGRFFMTGDPSCVRFKPTGNPRRILCMDAQGHITGRRRAMTDQELLMYTHRQQMRQMQDIETQLMFNWMDYYTPPWW